MLWVLQRGAEGSRYEIIHRTWNLLRERNSYHIWILPDVEDFLAKLWMQDPQGKPPVNKEHRDVRISQVVRLLDDGAPIHPHCDLSHVWGVDKCRPVRAFGFGENGIKLMRHSYMPYKDGGIPQIAPYISAEQIPQECLKKPTETQMILVWDTPHQAAVCAAVLHRNSRVLGVGPLAARAVENYTHINRKIPGSNQILPTLGVKDIL